jgi:putative DNA primase/helicase
MSRATREQMLDVAREMAEQDADSARDQTPDKTNGGDRASNLATIRIVKGEIARMVDEAEAALIAVASEAPIMVRAGMLVQPIVDLLPTSDGRKTEVTLLRPLTAANLVYLLNKHAAAFVKYDGRSKKWLPIDPPGAVATQLIEKGRWRFPRVAGVITAPTLRSDGTVLDQRGYDAATQLWHAPDSKLKLPPLSKSPSEEQAVEALDRLKGLLVGFPFRDVDRSVALAALLTVVCRGAFDVAPMNLFRAHDVGSGKSFLADLMSTISRGRPCPVITFHKSIEEMEKRLGALVLEGVPLISLDNCSQNIGGDLLCQITERSGGIRIRILGKSEAPECEWRGVLFATGNNVTLVGDMIRRGLIANLDPQVERPELRTFEFDPIERVLADRGAYIGAAITIARAYLAAGCPNVCGPLGSYGGWSRIVRSPLIWLGEQDPIVSMEQVREEDPDRRALHGLIELWLEDLQLNIGYRADEISFRANVLADPISEHGEEVEKRPALRELLLQQAGTTRGARGEIDNRKLGNWLTSIIGRVHAGHRIERERGTARGHRYALVKVTPP